ncbi:MAG TPA: MFS transporter [Gaiellales bacterium]|jgi:EmrB/QacA subfamily drug resistance transporter
MSAEVTDAPLVAHDRRRWIALAVVCLAMLMNTLDGSVVNVALPAIQNDLGFSQSNLSWVVNAYLIMFGSFLLLAGRLGDLIGRKRVFLAGVALFTLASAVCGLAEDQLVLVVARLFQGLGGAVSSSVIIALIITEFPDPLERARAMSAYIFVAVGGGSVGLLVGGVLTQTVNWHWIFFINIPIGLVTLALGWRLLEENTGIGLGQGIDWLGSILITAALMIGIYAIVKATEYGWTSGRTLGVLAIALAMIVAFFVLESRISNPILPLGVLRIPGLLGTCAVRGLVSAGLWATFFLGALYLERIRGFGALETGVAFMPMTVMVGILSLGVTARMQARFGAMRVAVPGLLVSTVALLLLSTADAHSGYFPRVFFAFLLLGLGSGSAFIPLLSLAMAQVPREHAGVASGVVNVSMQISAAIGLAILATISTDRAQTLTRRGEALTSALTGGYHLAFLVAAGCSAVGIVIALVVLRGPSRALAVQQRSQG